MSAILEVKNVSKRLGQGAAEVEALKDVNLALRGGELTLLMGPSGSGKTTLLSILGCMLAPTSGSVHVCGESTEGAGAEELARVGLSHKLASYPLELSGGEQQRVAIARAIVSNPSAILADEPTAALDAENGKAIMTILSSIASEPGRAVLVVTHDTRLLPFADRIHSIEDGRIVRETSQAALKSEIRAAARKR